MRARWNAAMSSLGLTLALVAGAACADTTPPMKGAPAAGCERLPVGWKLDEMLAGAREEKPRQARVLTWKIDEDDRPLRVERALLWLAVGDKRWRLVHLYRHPQDGPSARWQVSMVYDVPYAGSLDYDHPPTRADLDSFLKETWWGFEPEKYWKLVDAEACAPAWQASFGAPPWRSYKKK